MKRVIINILAIIALLACTPIESNETGLKPIRLSVVTGEVESRAYLYGSDLTKEKEFGFNAYLIDGNNTEYLNHTLVSYLNGGWYFRDQVYDQGKLLDYYWPNDHNVNFLAYMPYDMTKSVVNDFSFTDDRGISFNCDLSTSENNRTIDDTKNNTRTIKHEFVYAYRHDCERSESGEDVVHLRFVHPMAAIKFKLSQSHRDLKIHSITLSGLHNAGSYTNAEDTYENYWMTQKNQDALTYNHWTPSKEGSMTIKYEKSVPTDINYYSLIGGPYLVIPQSLEGVELTLNYSWDTNQKINTTPTAITTEEIPAWQPGKVYTYTLNLGDNREEILFKATVEDWEKGEDDGYENQYDVK